MKFSLSAFKELSIPPIRSDIEYREIMPDHKEIYTKHSKEYDFLISKEDYRKNLFPALSAIVDFKDRDIVELSAGTGRLTQMIAPIARTITAFDASAHMLDAAGDKLSALNRKNWSVAVADNRCLPLPDDSADVVIEGWGVGHMVTWNWPAWKSEIDAALSEMIRLCRPSGTLVLIETLGTGVDSPHPPGDRLPIFYSYLENELGFFHKWIRTDYRFDSVRQAEKAMRFFFGDQLADEIAAKQLLVVPECTGLWWKCYLPAKTLSADRA
jgi:ubiquinone/menaquinone biosynthesis C-methylase UbiE